MRDRWHRWGRSLLAGFVAAGIGLGLYEFDNGVKDTAVEGSLLKRVLNGIELLVMGPGMGVLGYVIVENLRLKDQSLQRSVEQERRQRFHLLGRIAASMAHEIRNPLQNLHLIHDELDHVAPPDMHHWLGRMQANLQRLDHAVHLAYELSRPHPQEQELEQVDLADVAQAVVQDLAPPAGTTTVDHHRPATAVRVGARPAALRVALENLLRNAFEAAPAGPITLRYHSTADEVHLEIRNPGVPTPVLLTGEEAITSAKPGGIGIGVSIARHLLRAMGGDLQYRAEPGTVVTAVRLALAHDPEDPA